jgi:hypothetical protein
MTHLVDAARAYIERLDLAVLVAGPNKVPNKKFFPHGVWDATRKLDVIERALGATPDATLAARVGRKLVLDVDVRHGGPERLTKLLAHFGPLPITWTQQTPSGGLHIWFQDPGFRPKGELAKGIECLTRNRLVTLSPSRRAGGRYRWLSHPLRVGLDRAPDWLLRAIHRPEPPKRPERTSNDDPATREKRARAWIAKANPAIQGQCGARRTFVVAMTVVRGFDIEPDVAFSLLSEWNQTCCPPWSERELKRKIKEAMRRGSMPFGAKLDRGAL